VTHTDAASYHVVQKTSGIINLTAIIPGSAWAQLRSYFAYEDADNCAYADLWGVLAGTPGNYYVTYYSRVAEMTDGTETVLASHTIAVVHTSSSFNRGAIGVTYDETTNIVRVVCMVTHSDNYQHWRSYDYLSLTQDPAKGLRYGWGYGTISGVASAVTSALDNLRHIDYCQGFPYLYVPSSTYVIDTTTHNFIKSTFPETATVEVTGVTCGSYYAAECSDCDSANGTFDMTRPALDQVQAEIWNAENLVTDDIDCGCIDTTIAAWNYKIQYRLQTYGLAIDGGAFTVRLAAYGIAYTPGRYNRPVLLATAEASFTGGCKAQADGSDLLDGLTFDQWTNAGTAGAPVEIIDGLPPVVILIFPDFSAASATIALP